VEESQRAETNVRRTTIKSPTDGMVVMASIVRNGPRKGDVIALQPPM